MKIQQIYWKLLIIGSLILVLQIPIAFIHGIIQERVQTRAEAKSFVTTLSGGEQTLIGPMLNIPYTRHYSDQAGLLHSAREIVQVLPNNLKVSAVVDVERRHRGIFEFPIYTAQLSIEGDFQALDLQPPGAQADDIDWANAVVSVGISDPRTIQESSALSWNGEPAAAASGLGSSLLNGKGIHFPIRSLTREKGQGEQRFSLSLRVGGSETLSFLPVGKTSIVKVNSPWANPSFVGNFLPISRSISKDGFSAEWKILDLGRSLPSVVYGERWDSEMDSSFVESRFGVGFYAPVDTHRMSERALKYELFVIVLTFLAFSLFELFSNQKVHPLQYFLIGAALVLFYLLLLSLSEHLGFSIAYALASILVLALVSGYSRSILRGGSGAGVVSFSLALLYGFFYTLLQEQDYSLLIGSLGLTCILGFVMYVTRNIDWHQLELGSRPTPTQD